MRGRQPCQSRERPSRRRRPSPIGTSAWRWRGGGVRRTDAVISEVVNVLDEGLHSLADGSFSLGVADTRELIARERLLEDRHERAVAGEIHGPCFTERTPTCRNVQAYERLAGT